jgi:hypothetical protein
MCMCVCMRERERERERRERESDTHIHTHTHTHSVPTLLGWYGYYKFSVEEELFQDELASEGRGVCVCVGVCV